MEISNTQTTYCSEAEEILIHHSKKTAECSLMESGHTKSYKAPRRSKRLTQKPEAAKETINWDNIRFIKDKVRLRYKKMQLTQNSSQFSTEKIADCSLKESGNTNEQSNPYRPLVLNKRYGANLQSIDLIAELETPAFLDQIPQNQMANMINKNVAGDSPMDLRIKFKSLGFMKNEDALVLTKNSKKRKVNQIMRKRKIAEPMDDTKLRKIEETVTTERNNVDILKIKNADYKTESLKQIPCPLESKAALAPNGNPTKRDLSILQPTDDQPTQKKNKRVISARRQFKPMQKSKRGRKPKNFTEDFVFLEKQQHFTNEETINENTINVLTLQPKACLPNFPGEISAEISDITKISEQTSLNNPSFVLQNSKNLFMQHNNVKQNTKFSSPQHISENSNSGNYKKASKINKYQSLRQKNMMTNEVKNKRVTPKEQESMGKISTKNEGTVYGQIPKITTIPFLPATTDSLLPKVYPPHFTGQLPAPISEPMPVRQLENAANLNGTQLILHCNRELNYWLTPELTQSFDEELVSSSTPSLTESLKDIFEADSFREILDIEKIVYRLGDNHVKALAMVLNIGTEILHEILKHIVRLDEKILKNVNSMMKSMPPTLDTFEINNSSERVEPNEMVISPISSSSVEIIESPKITPSRIFSSQRHTNVK